MNLRHPSALAALALTAAIMMPAHGYTTEFDEAGGAPHIDGVNLAPAVVRRGLRLQRQITAEARITDARGNPLPGLVVRFHAGNLSLCAAASDADGVAHCASPFLTQVDPLLRRGVVAVFDGDDTWEGTSTVEERMFGGR